MRSLLPLQTRSAPDPRNQTTEEGGHDAPRFGKGKREFMKTLLKGESGASALEYALLLALIAIVIIGGIRTLGATVNAWFAAAAAMFP